MQIDGNCDQRMNEPVVCVLVLTEKELSTVRAKVKLPKVSLVP